MSDCPGVGCWGDIEWLPMGTRFPSFEGDKKCSKIDYRVMAPQFCEITKTTRIVYFKIVNFMGM